jgi:hypothetical protein
MVVGRSDPPFGPTVVFASLLAGGADVEGEQLCGMVGRDGGAVGAGEDQIDPWGG